MTMRRSILSSLLFVALLAAWPSTSSAQLVAAKDGPIVYSHHHLNSGNVEAQRKFWLALGGVPAKLLGGVDVIRFPNVYIFITAKAPTDGSKGSTADHLGLQVSNLRATLDALRAAGYPIVTQAEMPTGIPGEMRDGAFFISAAKVSVAFVMGPEGSKVELVEVPTLATPVALHHVHLVTQQVPEMKAWYDKTFGAKIPGVSLLFQPSASPVAGTKGRVTDHIGFEVRDLEAFCKQLEASGVKLDRPYGKIPNMKIGLAFLTDPWGTYIELTEGLENAP